MDHLNPVGINEDRHQNKVEKQNTLSIPCGVYRGFVSTNILKLYVKCRRFLDLNRINALNLNDIGDITPALINGWINNREAGDLRRHRAHYDVIVMAGHFLAYFFW